MHDYLPLLEKKRSHRLPAAAHLLAAQAEELLRALRYERALVYEDLGRRRRACSELEKLYAEDPDHEDVAVRLEL